MTRIVDVLFLDDIFINICIHIFGYVKEGLIKLNQKFDSCLMQNNYERKNVYRFSIKY